MRISIQGNKGSYSHIAATSIFGKGIELIERDTFPEVFNDLDKSEADYIVIPIENSTYGSVYQNFDLLTQHNFHIVHEIYLIINFHLISFPDSTFEQIKNLYTHPVALGQIRGFLEKNPQIKSHEYPDTAGGVAMIKKENLKDSAGAASRLAAEMNGMKIIKEKIQDNPKNFTRFFVLSKTENPVEGYEKNSKADKTTLQFELGQEAGTLYKAIGAFAKKDISLSKIESRPILNTEWEYRFYIDILQGLSNPKMTKALQELKKNVRALRVLGSYPQGIYIDT